MTLDLATSEWGSGPRRALVIHGISSNSAGWWRLGPDLAGLGYHVVAPDLRGHGNSPKAEAMAITDYRDDVLDLGERWDLVLGHSLGGAIALACVEAVEGWVGRMILQDPAIIGGGDNPEVIAWLLSDYEEPITGERLAASNPRWHRTDAEIKAEALRQSGQEVVHRTVARGGWNYWEQLVGLSIPTLLIGADPKLGALVRPQIGAAAVEANNMIRFETVRGGSHSMHRDEYDAYWALIREFAA